MSLMSTGKLTMPTKEELEREFGSPYRPNNPIIMGSLEFIKKFNDAIDDYNKTHMTGTTNNSRRNGRI